MNRMIGICKLCKKQKELQRKCHIIPEFFYSDSSLFHNNHNLVKSDLSYFLKTGKIRIISPRQKSGEYDLYTYCKDCDGVIFNRLETYAKKILFSKSLPLTHQYKYIETPNSITISNIDYTKFKLFFLSILFRLGISTRELFKEVTLDDRIDELRDMILNCNPKSDKEFPIIIWDSYYDLQISRDYLFQPIGMSAGDDKGSLFGIGGILIYFGYDMNLIPYSNFLEYRLKEEGSITIMHLYSNQTWDLINHWYNK